MTTFNDCANAIESIETMLTAACREHKDILLNQQPPQYIEALLVFDDIRDLTAKLRTLCKVCETD